MIDYEQWRQRDNAQMRREVDEANRTPGHLNVNHIDARGNAVRGDGVNCALCMNRGGVYVLLVDEKGNGQRYFKPCKCLAQREAARRLMESGLEKAVKRCTFDAFETDADWQAKMKRTALRYAAEGVKNGAWMYLGGQSGCGKSHICTAAAGEILKDRALVYAVWPHVAQRIKAVANDAEAYEALVNPLRTAQALYIDDFLKPARGADGRMGGVTAADVRLAFDVLDMRYVLNLPTIISSEWFSSELGALDEAVAGRIVESAGEYLLDIGRDAARNWRMKGNVI